MILFIFGVLLAVFGVIGILVGNRTYTDSWDHERTLPARWVGFGLLGLAGLAFVISGLYTQSPGDVVVIKGPGGDIVGTDASPGLGFAMPWNSQLTFDITNQKIEMFSNEGGNGADGAAISAPVKEGTNVDVSVTVGFSQRAECIEEIVRNYRTESQMRERALRPGLRSEVRKATANYSAFEIKQRRGDLETDVLEALNKRWGDAICAEVESIDLGDLTLDSTTEEALSGVTVRQASVEEARAELERAQIKAEEVKTNAQAASAADQIIRCGATVTEETRTINGIETTIDVVTPVPVSRCQNNLNEQVLTQNYIEALAKIGEQGNLIVVSDDVNSILNLPAGG